MPFFDRVRELTLRLAEIPSVNGSRGESDILEDAYELLTDYPFAGRRLRLFRGEDPSGRPAFVLAHLVGTGPRAVLQFGHIDTVGVDDYGNLRHFAFRPLALTATIAQGALGPGLAEIAQSGKWLFGRGVFDMKAGVAATLATLEHLAFSPVEGHLLVALTADEEASSKGIRALSRFLAPYLDQEKLSLAGIINTDATGPKPGQGDRAERFVYSGSVGKLLPCAYVRGVPSHVGESAFGLDPNFVLAEITRRVVYSERLRDGAAAERSALPVSLGVRDDKLTYDVQTPLSAVGCYNVLYVERSPSELLAEFRSIVGAAAEAALRALAAGGGSPPEFKIYSLHELVQQAQRQGVWQELRAQLAPGLKDAGGPTPRIKAVEVLANAVLGREPAVVLFFGIGLIPKVSTAEAGRAKLAAILDRHAAETGNRYHQGRFFPLISDLSFVAASGDWQDDAWAENDPAAVVLSREEGPALVADAVYMIGPHGEGAHRVDERLFMPYSFEHVPQLLVRLTRELWRPPA